MPKCRSPQVKHVSLDELAELLARGSDDSQRLEAGRRTLRLQFARKKGVPPQEMEDLVQETIADFIAQVRARPGDSCIVNGGYLWGIGKRRFVDYLRGRRDDPLIDTLDDGELQQDSAFAESCRDAFQDRQSALSLQMHAAMVLKRAAEKGSNLLGGRLQSALATLHLVASHSASADAAFKATAALLLEEGVLGKPHTRNLRARLERQPELRRELSIAQRVVKAAKPGPSSDE